MAINKNGILTGIISNTLLCKYDEKFYIESDGSVWIRLFHHNNPTDNKFSSTDTFTSSVYKNSNMWFNMSICNLITGTWEIIFEQKETSTSSLQRFRWKQSYNPMTATFDQTKPANVTFVTSGYNTPSSSYGGMYKSASSTYLNCNNSTNGNWFGAVGSWTTWNNGIPGYNGVAITSGYLNIYLRVDNIIKATNRTNIYNIGSIANNFYEI